MPNKLYLECYSGISGDMTVACIYRTFANFAPMQYGDTWAKKGDLHSRRLAIAALGDKELVREIFEKVEQGMFADRQGGYTRIMKLGNRKGDNAPMVIMELVTEPVKKKEEPKPAAKKATKKAAPKKVEAAEEAPKEEAAEAKAEEAAVEVAEKAEEAAAENAEAAEVETADAKEEEAAK